MYANGGNLEQILWNICLKCFFLRILHQILKLNLCTWHTVTANIFWSNISFCFPVLLWADNKVNTYHFKSISISVNFLPMKSGSYFRIAAGYMDFDLQWSLCVTMVILLLYINPMEESWTFH